MSPDTKFEPPPISIIPPILLFLPPGPPPDGVFPWEHEGSCACRYMLGMQGAENHSCLWKQTPQERSIGRGR